VTSNLTYDYTRSSTTTEEPQLILLLHAVNTLDKLSDHTKFYQVVGYRGHHGCKYDTYCTPTCIVGTGSLS
jgi:hypothetical protein